MRYTEHSLRIFAELSYVCQHLRGALITLFRILLHRAQDELLQTRRYFGIQLSRRNCGVVDLHQSDGNRTVRVEGQLAVVIS